MHDIDQLIDSMTETQYQNLKQAVEIGKWPDGSRLSKEQRAQSMQALLVYQAKKLDNKEHLSINKEGHINHFSKKELKRTLS
jgi:uncharacterized protein YeaC (DUF1315 family)